jgi:hypothetical protein
LTPKILFHHGTKFVEKCIIASNTRTTRVVVHTVTLPLTLKKKYFKAKEELWKLKYFTMQIYNFQETTTMLIYIDMVN